MVMSRRYVLHTYKLHNADMASCTRTSICRRTAPMALAACQAGLVAAPGQSTAWLCFRNDSIVTMVPTWPAIDVFAFAPNITMSTTGSPITVTCGR